ncbi:MAG: DNA ligase D [Deltaproteobacteria bacterium]|nr:DNA ligase D [Deltaproteobacteria bacterium]
MADEKPLAEYNRKRDFSITEEPAGKAGPSTGPLRFVIQKHDARRLHYDFRLECNGVLWSWAVPRGPSLDPKDRRLAVRTEDHPLDYATFEGVIPKGQYGAGAVIVWDRGTWEPIGDPEKGLRDGKLAFVLHGDRCLGEWRLIRSGGTPEDKQEQWFLLKKTDEIAAPGVDLPTVHHTSVSTGRTIDEVREGIRKAPSLVPKGKTSPMPDVVLPELPTSTDSAPDHWLHEVKHDGYRVLVRVEDGVAKVTTRRGHDWTSRFRSIARAAEALPVNTAILDGEVVVRGPDGRSSFQALQQALAVGRGELHFIAFDLLYLEGRDVRGDPLVDRKELLEALVGRAGPAFSYSEHLQVPFATLLAQARALGLEGIVSKDPTAKYRSGRSKCWVKVKCRLTDTFVVNGFYPADDGGVASLRIGRLGDPAAAGGGVGTGFDHAMRVQLRKLLAPLAVGKPKRDGFQPVTPQVKIEVEYTEITDAGQVRHAVFRGVRDDLLEQPLEPIDAAAAIAPSDEARAVVSRLRITNPDRVFWPDLGITKAETIAYYATIADRVLPGIVDRPLAVVRCPEGVGGQQFFQKHLHAGRPAGVKTVPVPGDHEPQIYVESLDGLLGLVQMSVLELHPWGAKNGSHESPDRLIWDLDPDEELGWDVIADTAFRIRARLDALGLRSFARTTGGKGLHVVIPVEPTLDWESARGFTSLVSESVQRETPGLIVLTMGKKRRAGKIFIDVLRNARGATAVASWSTRARPGGKIAVPLEWSEVAAVGPSPWDVRTIWARLATQRADPWAELESVRQRITPEMVERIVTL